MASIFRFLRRKNVSVKGNWKWPWQKGKNIKVTIKDSVGSKDKVAS